jgi:CspA family cold shock protein
MSEDQAFVLSESGVVKSYNKERGFGFVTTDEGHDLFVSFVAVYKANRQTMDPGVRVEFTRGVGKNGKPRLERFLMISGVPAEYGKFTLVDGGTFTFTSEDPPPRPSKGAANKNPALGGIEAGSVEIFHKARGFGFITVDGGGRLFFYIVELMKANRNDIEPDTRVMFIRGRARDGRMKVAQFVEIDGVPVTVGNYSLAKGKFVRLPEDEPLAEPQVAAPIKVEIRVSKPEPQPAPAPPGIDKDEWLLVTLRKVRQGYTSYADSETLGQIIVPWLVLQKAKITSARNEERFELRCQLGDNRPVAHEIRRY